MGFVIEFMMLGLAFVCIYLSIDGIGKAKDKYDVVCEIISLVFFTACLIGFMVLVIMV